VVKYDEYPVGGVWSGKLFSKGCAGICYSNKYSVTLCANFRPTFPNLLKTCLDHGHRTTLYSSLLQSYGLKFYSD